MYAPTGSPREGILNLWFRILHDKTKVIYATFDSQYARQ